MPGGTTRKNAQRQLSAWIPSSAGAELADGRAGDRAAEHVAERAAHRDRQVEPREDAAAVARPDRGRRGSSARPGRRRPRRRRRGSASAGARRTSPPGPMRRWRGSRGSRRCRRAPSATCGRASQPKTGAPIMYETMNAMASKPMSASSGLKPRCARHQSWSASRVGRPPARARAEEAVLDRRDDGGEHLAVDVVEEVDEEQQRQRGPSTGEPARRGPHGGILRFFPVAFPDRLCYLGNRDRPR